jgi:hypothetical protein
MVYFDDSGRRIHRHISYNVPSADSVPSPVSGPGDAKARYIRQVAEENPRATSDEVYAEIHYVRNRHDISKDMVRRVLAKPRPKISRWPFSR